MDARFARRGGEPRQEETKRLGRLLTLIQLIANHPRRWTRRGLAERFGVSERQLDDDLAALRNGPLFAIGHARSGYYFERTPALGAVQYTASEALTLLLALQMARGNGSIDGESLATALARTEAALPAGLVDLASGLRRLGEVSAAQHRHRAEMLRTVQAALAERRPLAVVYESASRGGARSERVLRPYHLQTGGQSWILVAHDSVRGEVRDFVVDRIVHATPMDERYEIPPDFSVEAYRGQGWGLLRGMAGEPVEVVLRLTAEEGRRLRDEMHHPSQRVSVASDGTVEVRYHVGITGELVRWVFRWGTGCEVLAPDELRARVAEQARRLAANNGDE